MMWFNIKKILVCLTILILITCASAEEENYFLKIMRSGNTYGLGGDITIKDYVNGDLVLGGGNIIVNGNVRDDVTILGGNIIVNGDVGQDLRVFGGKAVVNGNVKGELVTLAGDLILSEKTTIDGDALIGGGNIKLNGKIAGDAKINAGDLKLGDNSAISGNLDVTVRENEGLGKGIPVQELKEKLGKTQVIRQNPVLARLRILGLIRGMIAALLLGAIILYLYPKFTTNLVNVLKTSPVKAGVTGFVMLVLTPFIGLFLVVTLIGFRVAAILGLLTFIGLLIATFPVKLVVGEAIYKRLFTKKSRRRIFYYLTGVVAFTLIYEIPIIGWLVKLAAGLTGFGALWILGLRGSALKGKMKL